MIYFLFPDETNVGVPGVYETWKIVAHHFPNEINKMYRQHNGS